MPAFGRQSLARLSTAHPDLQRLFRAVVEHWDCSVLEGFRDAAAQEAAFARGASQKHWPYGNHNAQPSNAVDVSPYPIDWKDPKRFCAFAGYVLGVAQGLQIPIRWGGDWDGDRDMTDQTFNDLVHFELRP